MTSMTVQFTCKKCGSSIHVYPETHAKEISCDVCGHLESVKFNEDHEKGTLKDCPSCLRKDFYSQKDFNRKVGVGLFVLMIIISTILLVFGVNPLWYLSPFVFLYALDFFLFRRLKALAICYNCNTIFRNVSNINEIPGFNHEMHDRIVYSGHDFQGKPLDH